LGDEASSNAIHEALCRTDFKEYADKVKESPNPFSSFQTDRPLLRLAEKQAEMAKLVVERDVITSGKKVAGVDAAYEGDYVSAACVVLDRSHRVLSEVSTKVEADFPYIPGYFYWREGPALAIAASGLDFDVLIVNAHGVAHPRRLGLASQLGLKLEKPTIGVSRQLLIGEIGKQRDGEAEIILGDTCVGVRLDGKPPLMVSVGHMISLETAVSVVKRFWTGEGLPRPLALANNLARASIHNTKLSSSANPNGPPVAVNRPFLINTESDAHKDQ
jgi:deoxyribonuclease V